MPRLTTFVRPSYPPDAGGHQSRLSASRERLRCCSFSAYLVVLGRLWIATRKVIDGRDAWTPTKLSGELTVQVQVTDYIQLRVRIGFH